MVETKEYRRPEPLTENDRPTQKIRCPILGFIHYSANEREIIDHPAFQRLRRIRQLALTEYVYPGATHSRFSHSLGVMEFATRAFDSICAKRGATLEKHFHEYPYFKEKPLDKARQVLRLAALLHDTGHAPFSHAAESIIQEDENHESLSVRIIKHETLTGEFPGVKKILDEYWENETSKIVASLIGGNLEPHLQILRDLISGEIDADRMDYLVRDSHHCGVDYGKFDHHRLIECMSVHFDESEIPQIALEESGLQTYEALLLARYQLNTQVYFHRIRRIFDNYLRSYFDCLAEDNFFKNASDILRQDDITLLNKIMVDSKNSSSAGHKWAKLIWERKFHKQVFFQGIIEYTRAKKEDIEKFDKLGDNLKKDFPDVDFITDFAKNEKPIWIHKLRQPSEDIEDHKEDTPGEKIKLIYSDNKVRDLAERSVILKYIPKRIKLPRLYAEISDSSIITYEEISEKAHKLFDPLGV